MSQKGQPLLGAGVAVAMRVAAACCVATVRGWPRSGSSSSDDSAVTHLLAGLALFRLASLHHREDSIG